MKRTDKKFLLAIFPILGTLVVSACGASTLEATPTLSVEAVQTSAVSTFVAGLTQTALVLPTNTPTETPNLALPNRLMLQPDLHQRCDHTG